MTSLEISEELKTAFITYFDNLCYWDDFEKKWVIAGGRIEHGGRREQLPEDVLETHISYFFKLIKVQVSSIQMKDFKKLLKKNLQKKKTKYKVKVFSGSCSYGDKTIFDYYDSLRLSETNKVSPYVKTYEDKGRKVTHNVWFFDDGYIFEHQYVEAKDSLTHEESSSVIKPFTREVLAFEEPVNREVLAFEEPVNREVLAFERYMNHTTLLKEPLSDKYLNPEDYFN